MYLNDIIIVCIWGTIEIYVFYHINRNSFARITQVRCGDLVIYSLGLRFVTCLFSFIQLHAGIVVHKVYSWVEVLTLIEVRITGATVAVRNMIRIWHNNLTSIGHHRQCGVSTNLTCFHKVTVVDLYCAIITWRRVLNALLKDLLFDCTQSRTWWL